MNEEIDQQRQKLSEEVLSGTKMWCRAHPKATFREVEQAVKEGRDESMKSTPALKLGTCPCQSHARSL